MNDKTAPRAELSDSDLGAVEKEPRSFFAYLGLLVRGLAMGAADVVPGVSGGTIAFISGIYDELIDSLRRCDLAAARLLLSLQIKDAWLHVNGNFLAAVFSGVLISILSLAKAVTYLLATSPILVWSFFFGLILSAGLYIGRQIPTWELAAPSVVTAGAGTCAGDILFEAYPATRDMVDAYGCGCHCCLRNDTSRDLWRLFTIGYGTI